MTAVTFIYCYPKALETDVGRVAVDRALASLAVELDDGVSRPERCGNSILVKDVEPRDLWQAMDRAVPDWEDRRLFFAPVFF